MYRLAIIGSRKFSDYSLLCGEMGKLPKPALIVSGGAKGADTLGKRYADEHGVPTKIFPAIWRPEGEGGPMDKGAGMKRNVDIVDESTAVLAFWDGDSTGTMHSINLCILKKKFVKIVYTGLPKKLDEKDIFGFSGKHRWLSNMWPVEIEVNGIKFDSVENAYQACKFAGQLDLIKKLSTMPALKTKSEAKKHIVTTVDFHGKKVKFMKMLLKKKFENPCLRQKLLNTGTIHIEETNTWGDDFWGCCPQGVGENNLGKLLMEIRQELADNATYKFERAEERQQALKDAQQP